MNNTLLMDAINYLDFNLLKTHLEIKEKAKSKEKNKSRRIIIKWSVAAACLCLVIAAGVPIASYIQSKLHEQGSSQEIIRIYHVGDSSENKAGKLTFDHVDEEQNIVSFTFIKKDNTPICFKFGGYIVKEEWTDEDGVLLQKAQHYDVITPYADYKPENGYMVMDVDLVITVNGSIVDTIPSEAGEYKITIDYSELYNALDRVFDCVEVLNFGTFIWY